jgi:hypothetical protein
VGIIEGLNEGEGHDDEEDRTHSRLSQCHLYTLPFYVRRWEV